MSAVEPIFSVNFNKNDGVNQNTQYSAKLKWNKEQQPATWQLMQQIPRRSDMYKEREPHLPDLK